MPQIIIRNSGNGGTGSRTMDAPNQTKVVIIVTNEQTEVYTGQDAIEKTSEK